MRRQQQRFPGLPGIGSLMQCHKPGTAGQQFDADIALAPFLRRQPAHDADSPDARVGRLHGQHLADIQPFAMPLGKNGTVTVVTLVLHTPGLRRRAHLLDDLIRR